MLIDLLPIMLSLLTVPLAAIGADVGTVLLIAWGVCGVLMVLISLMISAWLYRDCQARNAPSALWTVLGIIPVVNLVALCVYVFTEGQSGAGLCEEHKQPLIPGQGKCLICFQEEMVAEQKAMFQRLQAEHGQAGLPPDSDWQAGDVPVLNSSSKDRRATAPIASAPSTVLSLQQVGGVRHGTTTNLTTRNPFGEPVRSTIGRDAGCSLPLADEENVSHEHCTIGEDDDGNFYVFDLDSRNGTFVIRDGHETRAEGRHVIEDGDILRLGRTEFRVIVTRPSAAKEPLDS